MLAVQERNDLETVWRVHGTDLVRIATVLVGPSDAHDIAVEAVLRATGVISTGTVADARGYLFRSVTNRAHDLRRARRRRWVRDLHAVVPQITAGLRPVDVDVQRAVAGLSVAQRAVIYLAYWEDLTERKIAEVLDISPGTVRRHMVRARSHLRKALE